MNTQPIPLLTPRHEALSLKL